MWFRINMRYMTKCVLYIHNCKLSQTNCISIILYTLSSNGTIIKPKQFELPKIRIYTIILSGQPASTSINKSNANNNRKSARRTQTTYNHTHHMLIHETHIYTTNTILNEWMVGKYQPEAAAARAYFASIYVGAGVIKLLSIVIVCA